MYYRLKEPWRLRGYEHQLLLLERAGAPEAPYALTAPLFALLSRCDGETEFPPVLLSETERAVLNRYTDTGVIEALSEKAPVSPDQKYRHIENRRVPIAMINITGRCNMRCLHCFMASDSPLPPNEFSYEQLVSILDELRECGVASVYLTGGEPLLRPDFSRIVEAIHERGLKVTRIYTNGMLLTQDMLNLFRALSMSPEIVISFDGLGTHDFMRGIKGAEAAAERAIKLAVQNSLPVRATMNVNSKTWQSIAETGRYLYSLGVRGIFFVRTSESPKWLPHGGETLTMEDFCRITVNTVRELLYENRHGLALKFFGGMTLPPNATRELVDRSYMVYASEDAADSGWCNKAANTLFIASDGRVLPCDAFEGGTFASENFCADNNVLTRPLKDILRDSEYSRAMLIRTFDVVSCNPECENCRYIKKCHGGACRICGILAGAQETGDYRNLKSDILRASPMSCAMMKGGYYDEVLALLDGKA